MSDKSVTLKEILQDIDARIAHIEDMTADNRAVIVKLVKQSNEVVEFLKRVEVEEITDDLGEFEFPKIGDNNSKDDKKFKHIKELVDEFMDKQKDLKELEEELQKNKNKIKTGDIGEA